MQLSGRIYDLHAEGSGFNLEQKGEEKRMVVRKVNSEPFMRAEAVVQ